MKRRSLDSWVKGLYLRLSGRRYLTLGTVIAVFPALITIAIAVTMCADFLGFEERELLIGLVALELPMAVVLPLILLHIRPFYRALVEWVDAGERRDGALGSACWTLLGNLPRQAQRSVLLIATPIWVVPAVLALAGPDGYRAPTVAVVVTAVAVITAANAAWVRGALDVLIRPMMAEIATTTDRREAFDDAQSFGTRVVGTMALIVALVSGMTGLIILDHPPEWGDLFTVMIGVLAAVSLSAPVLLVHVRSILGPVEDLTGAAIGVRDGDLDISMPVTSSDEIGELTHSFNEMVEGLRDREALRGELAAASGRIAAASDQARRDVERDLHDGAQQSLVLLNLKLGMAERELRSDPDQAAGRIAEARQDLANALEELRALAHGIYPQALTSDGLDAALGQLDGVAVTRGDGGRYRPEIEAAVYFCCLEAVQNARKHAGEDVSIEITLSEADDRLVFSVADDGAGFDPASVNGSAGLQNMTDRITALDGTLHVDSAPGGGTRVRGSVPVSAAPPVP